MQLCLSLGVHQTVYEEEIKFGRSIDIGRLGLLRRLAFAFGLHESMVFWSESVVKVAVDMAVDTGLRRWLWPEKAAMVGGLVNLWWRGLGEEAEVLVAAPWVGRGRGVGVRTADVIGWVLYYLTVTLGLIKMVLIIRRLYSNIVRGRDIKDDTMVIVI
ncbi:uncharacterized protein LOC127245049 [Andrographis paniculata]|uniref:uncharacterized protein LOC127245049 n=1 Tax=Andrographis paniculata TaxID=175694 RepID=UPI0021E71EA4|nr:uncharacterized protein LOC127245049 [Andrographis paniculata]